MSIKEFLDSERNSFDSLLQDYDNMQPLYACPVLATNQFSYVYDSCPMFWDLDKGFFLKEDKIIPNVDLIMTFESESKPLDTDIIDSIIEYYFKNN